MIPLSAARSSSLRTLPLAAPDWRSARVVSQVSPRVCRLGIASIQLQNVVRRAHQRPFALNLLQPPQQELPEAAGLLDLAKHRLDDGFARRVDGGAGRPVQLAGHAI